MNREDVDWRGYWAAVPTPFRENGDLAPELLRALLDSYIDEGLHGVLVNGTTGEWFSQGPAERRLVAELAVEAVAGRVPVVIGCTDYTAELVAGLARDAIAAGADGFACTPPPYSKPFEAEVVAYYEDIARAVDAPMMIYNWPHGTGVEIGPELAARLADIETVVAFKDSTPDAGQFYASSARVVERVRVFGPYMTRAGHHELLEHGGDGTIGGGSLFGAADAGFWEAHWRGDHPAAQAHAERTEKLQAELWLPGGWAGRFGHYASQLKALMAILGQPGGTVRPPRLPVVDEESWDAMRVILAEASLLPREA